MIPHPNPGPKALPSQPLQIDRPSMSIFPLAFHSVAE